MYLLFSVAILQLCYITASIVTFHVALFAGTNTYSRKRTPIVHSFILPIYSVMPMMTDINQY